MVHIVRKGDEGDIRGSARLYVYLSRNLPQRRGGILNVARSAGQRGDVEAHGGRPSSPKAAEGIQGRNGSGGSVSVVPSMHLSVDCDRRA